MPHGTVALIIAEKLTVFGLTEELGVLGRINCYISDRAVSADDGLGDCD